MKRSVEGTQVIVEHVYGGTYDGLDELKALLLVNNNIGRILLNKLRST